MQGYVGTTVLVWLITIGCCVISGIGAIYVNALCPRLKSRYPWIIPTLLASCGASYVLSVIAGLGISLTMLDALGALLNT